MISYSLVDWGKPLEAVERPDPTPEGTEVLVRVRRSGVCHSDVHIRHGYFDLGDGQRFNMWDRGMKPPMTLGHEVFGEVIAAGPDADLAAHDAPVGSSRLIFPWLGCGNCECCAEDRENDCVAMKAIGIIRDGGYATHVLVPHPKYLVDVDGIDPDVATPYACSGLTVFSALKKVLPLRDDEWLAILGAGGLGLSAVTIAKAMGVENIVSVDIDDAKLEAAKESGARAALNSRGETADNIKALQEITGGRLLGAVDTVGAPPTAELGIGAMRKTGRYVLVGLHGGSTRVSLPTMAQRALTVRGSYVGSLPELRELIALVKTGKVKPIPVATRPLEQASETLDDLEAGRIVGRVVLTTE